jgi:hypothetical protein
MLNKNQHGLPTKNELERERGESGYVNELTMVIFCQRLKA